MEKGREGGQAGREVILEVKVWDLLVHFSILKKGKYICLTLEQYGFELCRPIYNADFFQ